MIVDRLGKLFEDRRKKDVKVEVDRRKKDQKTAVGKKTSNQNKK